MSNRFICKFFMNGACLKGDYCEFSHDLNDQPNNVCTFYQKGVCSYGSCCRYEHVKVSCDHPLPTTTARAASNSSQLRPHCRECLADVSNQTQQIGKSASALTAHQPAWRFDFHEDNLPEDGNSWPSNRTVQNQSSLLPAHLSICSFAAAGTCPYGKECPQMHGDLCATCGKQCLHPYRPSESGEHIKLCKRNNRRLETLKKSEEIECSVCMDLVLSKPTAAERRFGILSECDHSFCITCIRKWRSSSPTSGMDVDSTVRACPICRKISYYVIPSVMWYFSKEEKQEIVGGYKAKLKSIDCKYFDFGRDTCPFGSICFYKHAYSDGRLAEVAKIYLRPDDGSAAIIKSIGYEAVQIEALRKPQLPLQLVVDWWWLPIYITQKLLSLLREISNKLQGALET